jgi:hypothetical protein
MYAEYERCSLFWKRPGQRKTVLKILMLFLSFCQENIIKKLVKMIVRINEDRHFFNLGKDNRLKPQPTPVP